MSTQPPTFDPWAASPWSAARTKPDRPARTPWTNTLWEPDAESTASPVVLPAALAVAAGAALILRLESVGSAFAVTGAGVLAVAFGARGRRPAAWELTLASFAIVLAGVGTVRAAPWLTAVCLAGAAALGTLALVSARTWTGIAVAAAATALAPPRATAWLQRTLAARPLPGRGTWQVGALVAVVTAALLGLFGALFAAADPAFGELVDHVTPSWDVPALLRRVVVLVAVTAACLIAAFLAQRPPTTDVLAPRSWPTVPRWSWAVPLALLDLLFAAFVLVQLAVLFGGREHVLRTQGLTFAEYARQGFWQLLVVTVLTLAVVATAIRTANRRTTSERTLIRLLLGPMCALALVIVASAVHRMSLYEQEFGFTRLRLLATTVELLLGAVLVLLLIAGIRLNGTWLPRSVVGLCAAGLVAFAALNPDAYIAERNVARFAETGRIDVAYLATLSADAVPALLELPESVRYCALGPVSAGLRESADPWFDTNFARNHARSLLAGQRFEPCLYR